MARKELKSSLAKTGYSFADIAKMIGTSALNLPVSALIEANGDVVAAIDHLTARNSVILPKNRA